MRNAFCLAAGAAALLLAPAPGTAQRAATAHAGIAAWGRPHAAAGARRGRFVGGGRCLARSRSTRCFGNRFGRGGFGPDFGLFAYGYGGLSEDPEALRDQGFFAETGDSWAGNGHAVYDYDRGYPYDWYPEPAPAAAEGPRAGAGPAVRCEISWVSGRKGEASAVRVCRGRR